MLHLLLKRSNGYADARCSRYDLLVLGITEEPRLDQEGEVVSDGVRYAHGVKVAESQGKNKTGTSQGAITAHLRG